MSTINSLSILNDNQYRTNEKEGVFVQTYIAHKNEITGAVQTVKEHSENTAGLCREYAVPEMKDIVYRIGLYHDIGKYQESFQKRIRGADIRIEHSACGAQAIGQNDSSPAGLLMEYCIAGHHSGIPDGGFPNDTSQSLSLYGRMKREFEDFSRYKEELVRDGLNDKGWIKEWIQFLCRDCDNKIDRLVDKFAFLTRYAFSCLVDADSCDTAQFCGTGKSGRLKADFRSCLERTIQCLNSFVCTTDLQKARTLLQQQAFQRARQSAEIYLLNMPTGSGKTLASVKIALERAIAGNKKRIIYIIPYNSIIDQTAEVLENLFQEDMEIVRHQSSFSYEDDNSYSEDYREAARFAQENWDAPFIITTAVQFFESIYANKRGKLRKLHNMADSILIFDEAHLMPSNYLQPCLQAAAYLTRYLHSEAAFLTATMPDFERLLKEYALPDSRVLKLIQDTSLFAKFQKCRYVYLGELQVMDLFEKSKASPSSLIIVNKIAAARKLYQECGGRKYHLSTYMTSYDRKRVLKEIKEELAMLSREYPDPETVPEERRITIISTSLIEAGVDLDVHTVFRERSGLDNILQAGGRCNREGKRSGAEVYVFDFEDFGLRTAADERGNLTKGLFAKYRDISEIDCIEEYYNRWFSMKKEEIQKNAIHNDCSDIHSIPFRQYAEKFELIDNKTISLVVPRDEQSREMAESLKYSKSGNARRLQNYVCSVYQNELEDLLRQHAADDYGTGIFCLTNPDYYDETIGVLFEAVDYYI